MAPMPAHYWRNWLLFHGAIAVVGLAIMAGAHGDPATGSVGYLVVFVAAGAGVVNLLFDC